MNGLCIIWHTEIQNLFCVLIQIESFCNIKIIFHKIINTNTLDQMFLYEMKSMTAP